MSITNHCCYTECDFRAERVRQILAVIDVARVTGIDAVIIARSILNPRKERSIGRVGIDTTNPEEDAALDVITVRNAMSTLPKNATAEQIANACCPFASENHGKEEATDNRTHHDTSQPVSDGHRAATDGTEACRSTR